MTVAITPKGINVVPHDIAEMLIRCGKYDPEVTIPIAYTLLSYKKPLPTKEEIVKEVAGIIVHVRCNSDQVFFLTEEESAEIASMIVYGKEDVA